MACSYLMIILAAGKGTRLNLETPKVLCEANGKTLIDFPLDGALRLRDELSMDLSVGVVVGHKAELVTERINSHDLKDILVAEQKEQKGTAHAVESFFEAFPKCYEKDYVIIMCGDTPAIDFHHIKKLLKPLLEGKRPAGIVASFETSDPHGFGRIHRVGESFRIIEQKDTNDETAAIEEVNSGLYVVSLKHLKESLPKIKNENNSGEFYLTDLFCDRKDVDLHNFGKTSEFLGVNTLEQLAEISKTITLKKIKALLEMGVIVVDPTNTYVDEDVTIGRGTKLLPGVILRGKTKIGENCTLGPYVQVQDSEIGDSVTVNSFSDINQSRVASSCQIGPFARLRPQADIEEAAKIGNFVEIKKSKIGKGSKVSHLSYVGDAEVGSDVNIGCGFTAVNYDGVNKHKTEIGSGTFIGSGSQLIAPIKVGEDCFVAAGSTINQSMENGDFAIARQRQVIKKNLAKKFLKK